MSDIFSSMVKKNGTDLFMVTDTSIVKLVPVARLSKVEEELKRIHDACDENDIEDLRAKLDHLSQIDAALKSRKTVTMGGVVYEINSYLKNTLLDTKINSTINKRVNEKMNKNTSSEKMNKDILYLLSTKLLEQSDTEGINYIDYLRERLFFTMRNIGFVARMQNINGIHTTSQGGTAIFCAKYIPSFRIRYEGSMVKGVWEFPSLVIGSRITLIHARGDVPIFNFIDSPVVLDPPGYLHPFVFTDNRICIGTFSGSRQLMEIKKTPIITALFNFMCQVESILINYSEHTTPANGHLNNPVYKQFLIYNSIADEEKAEVENLQLKVKTNAKAARTRGERHPSPFRHG